MTEDRRQGVEGPTAEEMLKATVEAFMMQLVPHAPELAADPAKLEAFCLGVIRDQEVMAHIMDDATSPQKRAEKPWWGYRAVDANGGMMTVKAPKDMKEALKDPKDLFAFISILSVVTTPLARALLSIGGLRLDFFQAVRPDADETPKIIT